MFVLFLLFSQGDCEQERWNFTIKGIVKRPRLSVIPGTHYKKVNLTLQLYTLNNIMCRIQDDLFYIWKCHFNFWSKIFFFFFFLPTWNIFSSDPLQFLHGPLEVYRILKSRILKLENLDFVMHIRWLFTILCSLVFLSSKE